MCISTQSWVQKVQTGWDGAAIEHNVKTGGIFMQHKAWENFYLH